MAKHKQEDTEDWVQDARDLAKAERELRIEHWVWVSIGYRTKTCEMVILHSYDLPRDIMERYRWVIRWRTARLQCQYPHQYITAWHSYYDKRTGLKTGFNSCLGKLAAAKAQITKAGRCIERHIAAQRAKYPMFYDESADTELVKYREKLARKKENCRRAEENIRLAVENHRREQEPAS